MVPSLPGGIQRLQADQKGALVFSVEKILQFAQFLIEFLNVALPPISSPYVRRYSWDRSLLSGLRYSALPGTVRYSSY